MENGAAVHCQRADSSGCFTLNYKLYQLFTIASRTTLRTFSKVYELKGRLPERQRPSCVLHIIILF